MEALNVVPGGEGMQMIQDIGGLNANPGAM
jgi:hypothetical protein